MEWQFNTLQSGEIEGWNPAGLAQFRAGHYLIRSRNASEQSRQSKCFK